MHLSTHSWGSGPTHSLAVERRVVKRGDSLTLRLAAGGGQAIRFVAHVNEDSVAATP
jgi:hypothetical protein